MADLAAPRRFVGAHHSTTGAPLIIDEELQMFPVPGLEGVTMCPVYTQNGLPHDPHKAEEGAKAQPQGSIIDGTYMAFLEFPPGAQVPVHYTNSLDLAVLTHGELVYADHENQEHTIKAGTAIAHCAAAHGYTNKGSSPARMVVTVLQAKPFKIDGKDLKEAKGIYCMAE